MGQKGLLFSPLSEKFSLSMSNPRIAVSVAQPKRDCLDTLLDIFLCACFCCLFSCIYVCFVFHFALVYMVFVLGLFVCLFVNENFKTAIRMN